MREPDKDPEKTHQRVEYGIGILIVLLFLLWFSSFAHGELGHIFSM